MIFEATLIHSFVVVANSNNTQNIEYYTRNALTKEESAINEIIS